MIEKKIAYFEEPGENNTELTLRLAKERADELNIKHIVIASTRGKTALKAIEIFDPQIYNLIIVTHAVGFREPGESEFSDSIREEIIKKGAKILTCTHALSSVERAIRRKFNSIGPMELIAMALRLFGEGAKVAVEITIMAADAGLIPMNRDIIAIAGTGKGADSAFVIKPAHSNNFFDLFVKEIICKPLKH